MLKSLILRSIKKYVLVIAICSMYIGYSYGDDNGRYSREEFLRCDNDGDITYYLALNATLVEAVPNGLITDEPDRVWLHWTATGDDGLDGRATGYDIRYRRANYGQINSESRWRNSVQVNGEPTPSISGQRDSMLVTGLTPGESYYFCIKAYDDAGNYSGLSNSPLKTLPTSGFTLNVQINGPGSVDIHPEKEYYNSDEVVFLFAQPDPDCLFSRWTGSINSSQNPIMIYMNGNYSITANFISSTDYLPGDANGDGQVVISDVLFLVQFFRGWGLPPVVYLSGDCNGDCNVTGQDITYLVNFFRAIGPAPVAGYCDGATLSVDDTDEKNSVK